MILDRCRGLKSNRNETFLLLTNVPECSLKLKMFYYHCHRDLPNTAGEKSKKNSKKIDFSEFISVNYVKKQFTDIYKILLRLVRYSLFSKLNNTLKFTCEMHFDVHVLNAEYHMLHERLLYLPVSENGTT